MTVWVTIPCERNRLSDLKQTLDLLRHEPDRVIVVANGENPLTTDDVEGAAVVVAADSDEFNISSWWGTGIAYARSVGIPPSEILVLNSDARITAEGVELLRQALRGLDLSMVGPDAYGTCEGGQVRINTSATSVADWRLRVPGFCFMIAGEAQITIDERLRWWYTDDDVEWQARGLNGAGVVPGVWVSHPEYGGTRIKGPLVPIVAEDRKQFIAKWGFVPVFPEVGHQQDHDGSVEGVERPGGPRRRRDGRAENNSRVDL